MPTVKNTHSVVTAQIQQIYKMAANCIWLTVFILMVNGNDAARILGIFPTPAFSHQLTFQTVMKALAARGHQITVISTDPLKEPIPNYTDIDISFSYNYYRMKSDFSTSDQSSQYARVHNKVPMFTKLVDDQLNSPQIQEFIKNCSNNSYDLVFLEALLYQSYHGLIHHLGSPPVIGIMSFQFSVLLSNSFGVPNMPSYNPDTFHAFSDHMTFLERFQNSMFSLFVRYEVLIKHLALQEEVMRKHFGAAPPSVYEADKNISLVMVATSPIFNYPIPLPPAVITFHSIHVKTTADPLPKDLQEFLDEATDGVIYFSLGTNVLSNEMPEEKRNVFIEAFSELPQKVLWKWESDTLPGNPPNVRTAKWMPQQDILAHKNIKLFITQCGLQSIQEAVYHGVPMLGIPFFGDQMYNSRKIQETRIGIIYQLRDITKESLLQAINEILNNTSFRENARKVSTLSRDEPENSLQRLVWWTEYVLRHKGAKHLRSAAVNLEWYQYLLLDVMAFLLVLFFTIILISYYVIKYFFCCLMAIIEIKVKKD